MTAWRAADLARLSGAALPYGAVWRAQGAATRLEELRPGMIFIDLTGAADLTALALEAGAVAVLTGPEGAADLPPERVLRCPDPAAALLALARAARRRSKAQIVAIFGGLGKTVLADLVRTGLGAGVMQAEVAHREALSLALLNLPAEGYALIELRAAAPGQLAPWIDLLRPDFCVLTATAPRHLDRFGDQTTMARDMAEALRALPRGAGVVLPCDDPHWPEWRRRLGRSHSALSYGASPTAHHRVLRIHQGAAAVTARGRGWRTPILLRLEGQGAHLPVLAMGALALLRLLGADRARALCGFANWRPRTGMGGLRRIALDPVLEEKQFLLRDMSRHCDPISLCANLDWLTARAPQRPDGRRIALLASCPEIIAALEALPESAGIDHLFLIGPKLPEPLPACRTSAHFPTAAALLPRLNRLFQPGDLALIQGPPEARLHLVVDAMGKLGHRRR